MANEQIRLGVITEIHIVPPGTPEGIWHNPFLFDQAEELFGQAVHRCVEAEVDAIAILGDLTHFADPGSFAGVAAGAGNGRAAGLCAAGEPRSRHERSSAGRVSAGARPAECDRRAVPMWRSPRRSICC